jgi:hypothetical protein
MIFPPQDLLSCITEYKFHIGIHKAFADVISSRIAREKRNHEKYCPKTLSGSSQWHSMLFQYLNADRQAFVHAAVSRS